MTDANTTLAYFLSQVNPKASEARMGVHMFIVNLALSDAAEPLTPAEMETRIGVLFGQPTSPMTKAEISTALENCVQKGMVVPDGTHYVLPAYMSKHLEKLGAQVGDAGEVFRHGLCEAVEASIQRELTDGEAEVIIHVVEESLQNFFHGNIVEITDKHKQADWSLERFVEDQSVGSAFDFDAPLAKSLGEMMPIGRTLARVGIKNFLSQLPPKAKAYVRSLYFRIIYHQLLNMDPDLLDFEKKLCAARLFYLDTNVILAMLFGGESGAAAGEIISASTAMGCTVVYSPATLGEISRNTTRAKERHNRFKGKVTHGLLMKSNDIILQAYSRKRQEQRGLTWTGFISPYSDIEKYLADQYGIIKWEECSDKLVENEHYSLVWNSIADAKRLFAPARPWTPDGLINHDAENFVLVHEVRKLYGRDEKGPRVWLLTYDRKLRKAEIVLRKTHPIPHCMQVSEWGAWLLPLQNVAGFVFKDYLSYLVTSQLGMLSEDDGIYKIEFLEAAQDAGIDLTHLLALPDEYAARAIADLEHDKQVRDLLGEAKEAEEGQLSAIQDAFNERVVLAATSEQKATVLEREVYDLEKEIDDLRTSVESINKALIEQGRIAEKDRATVEHLRATLRNQKAEAEALLQSKNTEFNELSVSFERLGQVLEAKRTWRYRVLGLFGIEPEVERE